MNYKKNDKFESGLIIDQWKLSEDCGILASPAGKSVILEPRISKLLYLLCQDKGTIVSRSYLMEKIWPDTIVNEESLTRAIADLRKVIIANFSSEMIRIETIRKRGYRLILSAGPKPYILRFKVNQPFSVFLSGFILFLFALWWFLK